MIKSVDYTPDSKINNLETFEKKIDNTTLLFIKSHFKLYATNCISKSVKDIIDETSVFLLCDKHYSKHYMRANFTFTRFFPHQSTYLEMTSGLQIGDDSNEYPTWDIDKSTFPFEKNAVFIQKSLNLAQGVCPLLFNNVFEECVLEQEMIDTAYEFLQGTYVTFEGVCKTYGIISTPAKEVFRILEETSQNSEERTALLKTILATMRNLFRSYYEDYKTTVSTTMMMRNQILGDKAVSASRTQNKIAIVAGTAHLIPLDTESEKAVSSLFSKLEQEKIKYVVLKASKKIKDKNNLESWVSDFNLEKKQLKEKTNEEDNNSEFLSGPLIEVGAEIFEMDWTPKFWRLPENQMETPDLARMMVGFLDRVLTEIPPS